jgi:hypothetical protein
MHRSGPGGAERQFWRAMTVADVREQDQPDHLEVLFLESSRVYELRKGHPRFDQIVERLRVARETGRPVRVRISSPDSDVIEAVKA